MRISFSHGLLSWDNTTLDFGCGASGQTYVITACLCAPPPPPRATPSSSDPTRPEFQGAFFGRQCVEIETGLSRIPRDGLQTPHSLEKAGLLPPPTRLQAKLRSSLQQWQHFSKYPPSRKFRPSKVALPPRQAARGLQARSFTLCFGGRSPQNCFALKPLQYSTKISKMPFATRK